MSGYFINRITAKGKVPLKHKKQRILTPAEVLAVTRRELAKGHSVEIRRTALNPAPKVPVLRVRALREMEKLVGIVEKGGNNSGPEVLKIIRANGGTGPEPWCGDAVAYAYRKAGSKAVSRKWAAVINLGRIGGMKTLRSLEDARPGDLVVLFGPSTHVGMLVKKAGANLELIEGNTGNPGGVYRTRRHVSQVSRVVRVLR